MKTLCIYHTRSGNSREIARQIADAVGGEILAVSNGKKYGGFFGYIKAAVVGLKKKLPEILPCTPELPLEQYDKIVVIAPIWCENVSPVMRSFLAGNKGRFSGDLYYVISSMSGISYKQRIDELCALAGKQYTDVLQVKTHKNDYRDDVAKFAEKLK